ncbi:MAG TPA: hypothetical protein VGD55_06480 [Acidothermaceae bacterium]
MGGLVWWARIQWLQGQRPMWREHDATLAAVWRRDETGLHARRDPHADPFIEPPDTAEPVAHST